MVPPRYAHALTIIHVCLQSDINWRTKSYDNTHEHRSCSQFHFTSSTPLTVLQSPSKVPYWIRPPMRLTSQPTCSLTHTIVSNVACAKIQFRVSSLMNEVMDALSTVEVLSSFEYHDLLKSVSEMDMRNDTEPMAALH